MADGHCYWCSCDLSTNGWCSQRCITHHKTQDPKGFQDCFDKHKKGEAFRGLILLVGVVVVLVYIFG